MTTKNEKKQMEAKGGKKCTQSKANLIFRQYEV